MTMIMKRAAIGALSAAICLSGAAVAEPIAHLTLKGVIGRVVIVPASTGNIGVTITPGKGAGAKWAMRAFVVDGVTHIEGPRALWRNADCRNKGAGPEIKLDGGPWIALGDLAQIRVSAPAGLALEMRDSLASLTAGDVDSAEIGETACFGVTLGAVAQTLKLEVAGSGDFAAASAGEAKLSVAGSGNVRLGAVKGEVKADIAGSGSLDLGAVGGDFKLDVAGSGNAHVASVGQGVKLSIAGSGSVVIDGGRASRFGADIAGSGSVDFRGSAVAPDISIAGSGGVTIAAAEGEPSVSVFGSGEARIAGKHYGRK